MSKTRAILQDGDTSRKEPCDVYRFYSDDYDVFVTYRIY